MDNIVREPPFDCYPGKTSEWEWCLKEYDRLCAELAALKEEHQRLQQILEAATPLLRRLDELVTD